MAAATILEDASVKHNVYWDMESKLQIACEYIDNQCDDACFADYVEQRAQDEEDIDLGEEVSQESTIQSVDGSDMPSHCECDNTHKAAGTVCRWCYARGRRHWDDPEIR